MKRTIYILSIMLVALMVAGSICGYADGDTNIDGGGGSMDGADGDHVWNSGNEGVRISVVRGGDNAVVGNTVDFTNKKANYIFLHFGTISKFEYSEEVLLSPTTDQYQYCNPKQRLPRIISTGDGNNNIEAIKRYFCSEYVLKRIAEEVGIQYSTLIGGNYKVLLEPIAYLKYNGVMYAMTAHEAALYDEQTGGKLRKALGNLTHKNLPLAMFLETADLGFAAWNGTTNGLVSNASIKTALGLGVVSFKDGKPSMGGSGGDSGDSGDSGGGNNGDGDSEEAPDTAYDYIYRVDTDVISAVWVSSHRGGQSDPKTPTMVRFDILGRTYTVSNVYYPDGDSQLVWVKWRTPSTSQEVTISVSVSGAGSADSSTIHCNIVDLAGSPPPNPVANDRNDSFTHSRPPTMPEKITASWGVWRPWWKANWVWVANWKWVSDWEWEDIGCYAGCPSDCAQEHRKRVDNGSWEDRGKWQDKGWYEFEYDRYSANLSADMDITCDAKSPTASGSVMKSGYGINQTVTASVGSSQSSATTPAQTAVSRFPEFGYEDYWRLLERTRSGNGSEFQFAPNEYSTYNRRTHFTPLWMPDGSYVAHTWLLDSWTPAGMLSVNLTDELTIRGSLWDDWHIAPKSID